MTLGCQSMTGNLPTFPAVRCYASHTANLQIRLCCILVGVSYGELSAEGNSHA